MTICDGLHGWRQQKQRQRQRQWRRRRQWQPVVAAAAHTSGRGSAPCSRSAGQLPSGPPSLTSRNCRAICAGDSPAGVHRAAFSSRTWRPPSPRRGQCASQLVVAAGQVRDGSTASCLLAVWMRRMRGSTTTACRLQRMLPLLQAAAGATATATRDYRSKQHRGGVPRTACGRFFACRAALTSDISGRSAGCSSPGCAERFEGQKKAVVSTGNSDMMVWGGRGRRWWPWLLLFGWIVA